MNNYYAQYGGQCSNSQEYYYPNTYNLWESSFYNTVNFATNDYYGYDTLVYGQASSSVYEGDDNDGAAVDSKNRRIIKRRALYEDPDVFYGQDTTDVHLNESKEKDIQEWEEAKRNSYSPGYDWTRQNWQKAVDGGEGSSQGDAHPHQAPSVKSNTLQKQLTKALSQPVKLSKAESMMQKMGWQGGALGKTGDGIIEPIAPNAAYASATIGFGQKIQLSKKMEKLSNGECNKEFFKTNVLLHILEFVKNDTEVEVVFDRQLWKDERKLVHNIVSSVANCEEENSIDYDNVAQMDTVQEIHEHNKYVLGTHSEGVTPHRQLCMYKEAPEHVYLITPDDLKENDEKSNDEELNDNKVENGEATEEEAEDTNPFLRSITRNLRKQPENISDEFKKGCHIDSGNDEPKTMEKLVEYALEFAEQDAFTELRFLGAFTTEQRDAINMLFNDIEMYINSPNDETLAKIFKNKCLSVELKRDCNGSMVIYKLK